MGLGDLFPQEELRRKKASSEAYEAWESEQPPGLPPEDLFERLDAIRALLPPALRVPRPDCDYEGIHRMHEALAVLERSK